MRKAFAAVAIAAATLSIATFAVANGSSRATYIPQAPDTFKTFGPLGAAQSVVPTLPVTTPDPTATPTSTPSPTGTPASALDIAVRPSIPPVSGGTTVTHVLVTPRPTPRPLPPAPNPAPVSGTPSVAAAQAFALSQIGSVQYSCLYQLWMHESGWNTFARNPSSGAYGIPQALPGYKMATAGADWATNPVTQVRWGLGYVAHYGGACAAWAFWQSHGWY